METIEFIAGPMASKTNKGESVFLILQVVVVVLCCVFFQSLLLTINSAIFIVVINNILIVFVSKLRNKALKNEIYKLIVIGFNLIFFELLFEEKRWIILFLFNFHTLMYGVFFLLYFKRFSFLNKEIQVYIYFVNCLLFFCFLLVNAEVISSTCFEERYVSNIRHVYMGIKSILLFVSVLTLLQWGSKQVKNRMIQNLIRVKHKLRTFGGFVKVDRTK